jgi:hypothetical protein
MTQIEPIGKYLKAHQWTAKGRKTANWTIISNSEAVLGDVAWYSPWRRYCFHPVKGTVLDPVCMRDIRARRRRRLRFQFTSPTS